MASRAMPGLGLQAEWALGENAWKAGMDWNMFQLSVLTQSRILGRVTALPGAPTNGETYLLTEGVNAQKIAVYDVDEWVFLTPGDGWRVYDIDVQAMIYFNGTVWFNPLDELDTKVAEAAASAAAAEAALAATEANASASLSFSTRTVAMTFSPTVAPNYLWVEGYAAVGDGGRALYVKVVSQPTHNGKLSITHQNATVAWYELAKQPIRAEMFGAVFDNTTPDRAKIKEAAVFATSKQYPFLVPDKGLLPGTGILMRIPEDAAELQAFINTVAALWVFPRNRPDTAAPYAAPYLLTIELPASMITVSGHGYVWPFPLGGAGDLIRLRGRGAVSLGTPTLIGQSSTAGLVFVTVGVPSVPAGLAVGSYLTILLTYGTNEHAAIRGCWQVSAVTGNQITFKVNYASASSIPGMTLTGWTAIYMPSVLRVINMPFDGADRGIIDVQEYCHLCLEDVVISGDSSGTNASSTQGIMIRKGAVCDFEQYVGIYGAPRAGIWFVEGGHGRISFGCISYCGTGINAISGSKVIFDYGVANGNTSNNIVVGIGATMSAAPVTSMGCPSRQVYVLNNGEFITSAAGGFSRIGKGAYGVVCESGGLAHLNDIPIVNCTAVGAVAKAGCLIMHDGGMSGNGINYKPALETTVKGGLITATWGADPP